MKKFYVVIFIFIFCFLDINPFLKSKAFSLKEQTLISLNDENISGKLVNLYSDLIEAESYGDAKKIDKLIDQIIAFEEKKYGDKIFDIDYTPVDLEHLIIEKKYQLGTYYYDNYLVDKIDLIIGTYENGVLFLEKVPDKDVNLKLDYLVLYANILREKNSFKKELIIRKKILDLEGVYSGKDHEYYFDALNQLGISELDNDNFLKANKIFNDLIIRSQKSNPADLGYYYLNLAISYNNLSDKINEKKYLIKSLKTLKKQFGDKSADAAHLYAELGFYYLMASDYKKAEDNLNKALKLQNRLNDNTTKEDLIYTYQYLSNLYQRRSNFRESEKYILKAVDLNKKLFGKKNIKYIQLMDQYADIQIDKDNYLKAIEIFKNNLEVLEELDIKGFDYSNVLNALGLAYWELGDYKKAKEYLNATLINDKKLISKLDVEYATTLHNLALVYDDEGAFQKAEELYLESLEITIKDVGENHYETVVTLSELAGFYNKYGFSKKADKYINKAIKISEKLFKDNNIQNSTNFSFLSDIYIQKGDYKNAEKFAKKALEIQKKSLPKDHYDFGNTYGLLATIKEFQNDFEKSEFYLNKSANILINSGENDSVEASIGYQDLGSLYSSKGLYSDAINYYLKSLTIKRKNFNDTHPSISTLNTSLAYAYSQLDQYSESSKLFEKSITQDLLYLQKEIPLLGLKDRQNFYDNFLFNDDYLYSVATKNKDLTKLALFKRINYQGILEDIEKRQSNLKSISNEALKLKNKLKLINAQISNIKISKKEKDKLVSEKSKLEKKLFKILPKYEPLIVKVEDISKQLKDDEILVEYQLFYPISINYDYPVARYLAFTLDNQMNIKVYDLGITETINPLVAKVINSAENKKNDFDEQLQKIKNLIISPLEKDLANKKNIYLSPDSELNRVPYSAFNIKSEGNNKNDYKNIRVLTSSRELIEINSKSKNKRTKKSLIVANPAFNLKESINDKTEFIPQKRSIDLRNLRWTSLPGTLKEGKAINKIIKSNLFTDKKATVLNIQKYSSPKLLHIASHSYYLPSKEGENSLLRSGIVLAGANNPFLNPRDDGYLTALEATNLNLDGTDLVVISGCESGQGDIKSGQGVYGLRRSFAVAGAKSQLLSLWKVDDLGTAAFMEAFYKNLDKGIAKDIALKNTQKEFQNHPIPSWRHPYIWAAFQLSGSWNPINF